jgi:hypothetical protein
MPTETQKPHMQLTENRQNQKNNPTKPEQPSQKSDIKEITFEPDSKTNIQSPFIHPRRSSVRP